MCTCVFVVRRLSINYFAHCGEEGTLKLEGYCAYCTAAKDNSTCQFICLYSLHEARYTSIQYQLQKFAYLGLVYIFRKARKLLTCAVLQFIQLLSM